MSLLHNLLNFFNNDTSQPSHDPLFDSSGTGDLPPGDIALTSNVIPENIRAFRTITTMLSQIPRSLPIDVVDNLKNVSDSDNRQEIRIVNAFAHLAVGEHDIAALATNHSSRHSSRDSRTLNVIVSTDSPLAEDKPSTSSPAEVKRSTWIFNITRNYRRDDATTASITPLPTTILASKPCDLGNRSALEYMKDLESKW
jgi:hypothetical protein